MDTRLRKTIRCAENFTVNSNSPCLVMFEPFTFTCDASSSAMRVILGQLQLQGTSNNIWLTIINESRTKWGITDKCFFGCHRSLIINNYRPQGSQMVAKSERSYW